MSLAHHLRTLGVALSVAPALGGLMGCEEGPPPANMAPAPPVVGGTTAPPPDVTEPPEVVTPPPPPPECPADAPLDPGPTLVRRLNRTEYDHTVRDLLGEDLGLALGAFTPEEEMLGFDNNARALQVTPVHAEQFMTGAEAVAGHVAADFAAFLPCDPAEIGEDACAAAFIHTFGRRAWRRPLTAAEQARLMALYAEGEALEGPAFETGLSLVVQALLQSPHFLYRVEVGTPVEGDATLRALTADELASRLSYLLWASMPDAALFDAADRGELSTPEGIAAQSARLLADPRARDGLWRFFVQWLAIEDVPSLVRDARYYPDVTPEQLAALVGETRAFVEFVVFEARDMRALFDAPYSFRNAALASLYGEDVGAGLGDALVKVPVDPQVRRGVLTHGSILAATAKPNMTSPVHRGKFIREHIFCETLPPPPAGVPIVAPDPDPALTTRERWAIHSSEPSCRGCHQLIDPPGFLFEGYDAVGKARSVENGHPIDATGRLIGTGELDGDYADGVALARALATSETAHRCLTTQFFRYAFGRGETSVDACTLDDLYTGYAEAGAYDFNALVGALTAHPAFRHRRAQGFEEVAP